MKKRIKIDISIAVFTVVLTAILYQYPQLYLRQLWFDDLADFVGLLFLWKGTLIRMVARGHKKINSQQSQTLVTTGIYQYTRNPKNLEKMI